MLFFPTETTFSLSSTYNNIIILSIQKKCSKYKAHLSSKLVLGGNYKDDGILHLIHHLRHEYEEELVCRYIHQECDGRLQLQHGGELNHAVPGGAGLIQDRFPEASAPRLVDLCPSSLFWSRGLWDLFGDFLSSWDLKFLPWHQ
jgi:hypothetical protein